MSISLPDWFPKNGSFTFAFIVLAIIIIITFFAIVIGRLRAKKEIKDNNNNGNGPAHNKTRYFNALGPKGADDNNGNGPAHNMARDSGGLGPKGADIEAGGSGDGKTPKANAAPNGNGNGQGLHSPGMQGPRAPMQNGSGSGGNGGGGPMGHHIVPMWYGQGPPYPGGWAWNAGVRAALHNGSRFGPNGPPAVSHESMMECPRNYFYSWG